MAVVVLGVWAAMWVGVAVQGVRASDPDPLMDFCVQSDPNMACASASSLSGTNFRSAQLQAPSSASTTLATGVSITASTASSFAALSTLGVSMTRIDFHPSGLLPPHVHPRATEVLFLVTGSLQVGFVDGANNHFATTLGPGDMFVFPRGLVHYALNMSPNPAMSISAFNSQNPGASFISQVFTSSPPLPDEVLEKAFSLSEEEVERLRSTVHKFVQH